jgi:predicted  nucleic acid-binding Zn-ribbon protein
VVHFADMSDEERIRRLEHKVAEIRKTLFGALLLAKNMWGEDLSRKGEGTEIMKAMEKAEEAFTGGAQPDRFKRLEQAIDVIEQRAKSIFDLMSYMSKYKKNE